MNSKQVLYILIALGIIVAVYLVITEYVPKALVCPATGSLNCESVITSQYSTIFGVPLSVLGVILFLLAPIMIFRSNDMKFLWSLAGAAAVLYSVTTQILLGFWCIYCVTLDIIILVTIYMANRKPKQNKTPASPTPANPANMQTPITQ